MFTLFSLEQALVSMRLRLLIAEKEIPVITLHLLKSDVQNLLQSGVLNLLQSGVLATFSVRCKIFTDIINWNNRFLASIIVARA